MVEVKWIKLTTTMFEDEKIDFILSLPEGDSILLIWIRLLTMAGKCNSNGFVFLTEQIPYTEDMLAHKFKKSINIVKLALSTFTRLGMIENDDNGYIYLTNWRKHQNIEGLEKIREQNRIRKQKQRERENNKKLEEIMDVTDVTKMSRDSHGTDREREVEEDLDSVNFSLQGTNA